MSLLRNVVTLLDHWPAHRVFLLDGVGAGVSLGMTVVVLLLQPWFGMPTETVKILIPLTAICMVYSLLCWFFRPERWRRLLLLIALANLGYAVSILTLLVVQRDALTPLGVAYFGGEVVVLVALGCLESRKSMRHR